MTEEELSFLPLEQEILKIEEEYNNKLLSIHNKVHEKPSTGSEAIYDPF